MGMLSVIFKSRKFFRHCYNPLGDLMDLIALLNSSVNFILYCLMSTQFRATIAKLVKRKGTNALATSVLAKTTYV